MAERAFFSGPLSGRVDAGVEAVAAHPVQCPGDTEGLDATQRRLLDVSDLVVSDVEKSPGASPSC